MGTSTKHIALLAGMTAVFAGLALDITVPAVVLSMMALARSAVSLDFVPAGPHVGPLGETA